ncbi:MAG: thioredoxin family protein [Bacillaceae bacterium]|nr:thioredoxin family protein [Bacillaceae bacterium]
MEYCDQQTIEQAIESEKNLVAILFSSPACGYCTMLERNLQQILPSLPPFSIYKYNTQDSGELAEKYHISSIPCLKLFKEGEQVHTLFGVRTPDDLYYTIKSYL